MKKHWITLATAVIVLAGTAEALASPGSPVVRIEARNAYADPYMRKAGEKVYLNYLNLEGNTVVVKVLDEEGRLLFFERFKDTPVVEKAFNFEQAASGTYRVQVLVSEGDRTYSESLKVVR
jgi:hypothetical protein